MPQNIHTYKPNWLLIIQLEKPESNLDFFLSMIKYVGSQVHIFWQGSLQVGQKNYAASQVSLLSDYWIYGHISKDLDLSLRIVINAGFTCTSLKLFKNLS